MHSKNKTLIIFTIITCLLFLSSPFLAHASIGVAPANPDPNIKFSDSWFVYTLKPGEEKNDAMIVNNNSEEIATVKVFPVEAEINSQGTFVTDAEKKVDQGVSQWIIVSKPEIKLGPGESQKVEFTLRVPEKIEPKQYLGAVMAEQIKAEKPGEETTEENQVGQSFNIRSMVGVRMYLTVENPKSKFSPWYGILIIIFIIGLSFFIYYFFLKSKRKKNIWQRIFKR